MQIGETIRTYRKQANMTQEEMARRLGVTAPAVNKWEKGNSLPDITLLAPIARLLGVSLDTLLSFHDELTAEEITRFVYEAEKRFKSQSYEDVFQWAKESIEIYPNCAELILQLAAVLDAQRLINDVPDTERYDEQVKDYYIRALEGGGEDTRIRAADALYGYYFRKEQYDKAEECLSWFSVQNPERKRKQAQLYQKTGRKQEACKAFEELLFLDYQRASATLHNLYMLAIQEDHVEKARDITRRQSQLAVVFDMGKYYEASCKLDLATWEQDVETVITTMREMLTGVEHISDFQKSSLYEHMDFREPRKEFIKELKQNLVTCFRDRETYHFLENDPRWIELTRGVHHKLSF